MNHPINKEIHPLTHKFFQSDFSQSGSYERAPALHMASRSCECLYCSVQMNSGAGIVRHNGRAVDTRSCVNCRAWLVESFGTEWFTAQWHTELVPAHIALYAEPSAAIFDDCIVEPIEAITQHGVKSSHSRAARPPMNSQYSSVYVAVRDLVLIAKSLEDRDEENVPVIRQRIACSDKQWSALVARDGSPNTPRTFELAWNAFVASETGRILMNNSIGEVKMRRLLVLRGYRSKSNDTTKRVNSGSTELRRIVQSQLVNRPSKRGSLTIPSEHLLIDYVVQAKAETSFTPPDTAAVKLGTLLFLNAKRPQRFAVVEASL